MTRQELIDFCLTFPAAYENYPFDISMSKNPTAVMRHKRNKKSFALIMRHNGELYLNLKCEPLEAEFLRSVYKSVIPGWHMNKTHWNTVIIGGDAPDAVIKQMIGRSYDLIKPKIRRKSR